MPLSPAAQRSMDTIQGLLDFSDFYGAHQKLRTAATRLLSSRTGPVSTAFDGKAQDAALLLGEGARLLLEKGQVGSGTDLAVYLIEVWSARGVACGDEQRTQLLQLIALTGPSGSWRKTFTDAVFAWSAKTGSGPAGDAAIHGYLGEVLFKEQSYHLASLHLLLCPTHDAARTLADVMFAWSQLDDEGVTGSGRYAARGLLSYLEYTAILPARTFLARFISLLLAAHPDLLVARFAFPPVNSALSKISSSASVEPDEMIVTKLASINFLQLTLKTCQTGAGEGIEKIKGTDGTYKDSKGKGKMAWTTMLAKYEKDVAWLRRPEAKDSTQELGTIYFGIKPPRPAGNMMADMLSNLFSGGAPPAAGAGRGAPAIRGR